MIIQAGKTYANDYGAAIKIVTAPNDKCRWFRGEDGSCYHATGELVCIDSSPRFNLIKEITG